MRQFIITWTFFLILVSHEIVLSVADGPDFWEIYGIPEWDVLNIREKPDWRSAKIGVIPHKASCIKNLGCVGGLTFEEYTTLPKSEHKKIEKERPRWCKIKYQGQTGWVAARYLREGERQDRCDPNHPPSPK